MCPSAASTLSTGRKYQAEAAATADMRKNMRKNMSTAGFCCCLLPKHASQAYCLMLMNVVVATAQLLTTAQAMLKMKSACFEKASQEIGVPRGKKSERYRSTPHYRSRSLVLALRKRLRKSGYREGRKASATAQPLTDTRTDDNLFRFRASVYPW